MSLAHLINQLSEFYDAVEIDYFSKILTREEESHEYWFNELLEDTKKTYKIDGETPTIIYFASRYFDLGL